MQTWFISVIMACYLLAALIRFDRIFLPLSVAVTLALLLNHASNYWGCILQFLAGGIIARADRPKLGALLVAVAALAADPHVEGFCVGISVGALALLGGLYLVGPGSKTISWLSLVSYEFFLVHGIAYLALGRLAHLSFAPNLLLGTPLVILMAWALHWITKKIYQIADTKTVGRTRPITTS